MDLETKLAVIDKAAKYLEGLNTEIFKLQKEKEAFEAGIETLLKVLDVCPPVPWRKRILSAVMCRGRGRGKVVPEV